MGKGTKSTTPNGTGKKIFGKRGAKRKKIMKVALRQKPRAPIKGDKGYAKVVSPCNASACCAQRLHKHGRTDDHDDRRRAADAAANTNANAAQRRIQHHIISAVTAVRPADAAAPAVPPPPARIVTTAATRLRRNRRRRSASGWGTGLARSWWRTRG